MELRKSERSKAKIKMALQGSSGSGKTMSALLIAKGLTNGNLSKVAVIDSENGSADLYAHLGDYNIITLKSFSPNDYVEAISVCENAGMECIIVDSASHCWNYLLDYHASLPGNSFTNWQKINPMEKKFIDKILQCNAHVIATMRTKQDYVLTDKNGKMVPEKVGLKAIQRDGLDFEFTIVLDIDIKHNAVASKDRTQLFDNLPPFVITEATGKKVLDWCNVTSNPTSSVADKAIVLINSCNSIEELTLLYQTNPEVRKYDTELQERATYLRKSNTSSNGVGKQY